MEEASKSKISSIHEIEQYNASGAFALARFPLAGGRAVWLKATGDPNRYELSITAALAAISPESLPPLLAVRSDWNAWLMEEAGEPLDTCVEEATLEHAVTSIAALQKRMIPHSEVLFAAGVIDHRMQILRSNIGEFIAYLEEAMGRQTSTKAPRIKALRLHEIGAILDDACGAIEELGIPNTILHNDINPGNLLFSEDRCVFTDWCEASIGNPFITLEHLLLLLPRDEKQAEAVRIRLKQAYREFWRDWLWDRQIDRAMTLAPLLAAFSSLYGRGDWLRSERRYDSAMQSYARSLARHMDRAALAMEVVCR